MENTIRATNLLAVVVVFAAAMQVESAEPQRRPVPVEVIDPPWLASRGQHQLEAARDYKHGDEMPDFVAVETSRPTPVEQGTWARIKQIFGR